MARSTRFRWLPAAALLAAAAAAVYVPTVLRFPGAPRPEESGCVRIVSLSPNLTEILFELGLGARVVGVTRFCDYPPGAARLPRVGGFFDASIEAIVFLAPDLVVLLPAHERVRDALEEVGIGCLEVGNETIGDILASISLIGARCGVSENAAAMRAELERRLVAVRELTAGVESPAVLVVVSRDYLAAPAGVWAAGRGTFYDELLEAAGGRNVLVSGAPAYPQLSREGLLRLDPDVIIEIVADADKRGLSPDGIAGDWRALARLRAVAAGRVIVITRDHAAVPGPRFVQLLDEFVAALHPDLPLPDTVRR